MSYPETIIWTALPNGIRDGKLKLSVFVSPRLTPVSSSGTLEQFPDFLSWPSKVRTIGFAVEFANGPTIESDAVRRDPESPVPQPELWAALFNNATLVRPHAVKNFQGRNVRSFPVANVMDFLKGQYQDIAANSEWASEPPPISVLNEPARFGRIRFFKAPMDTPERNRFTSRSKTDSHYQNYVTNLKNRLRTRFGLLKLPEANRESVVNAVSNLIQDPFTEPDDDLIRAMNSVQQELTTNHAVSNLSPDPPRDFLQVRLFHLSTYGPKPVEPKVEIPEIDFHKILSSFGQYSEIMRRLGLVVDLLVPIVPGLPSPQGSVRVVPQWSPSPPLGMPINFVEKKPYTRYDLNLPASKFLPQPGSSADISNGMLKLGNSNYDIVQVDVDGAAITAMAFANNLNRVLSPAFRTTDTPQTATLPSLKSAGISIIRKGRAPRLVSQFANTSEMNSNIISGDGAGAFLWAEDIIRGYIIDVWDDVSGKWRSLCKRKGIYEFLNAPADKSKVEIEDDGWVSAAATSAADGSSADLYLHESLFRWGGWGLCVPRPGKTIDHNYDTGYDEPRRVENGPVTEFKLKTSFEPVAGSLPRLRFGRKYRIRARAVDLAGNSLQPDQADALMGSESVTNEVTYFRFEPVSSPVVLPRKPLTAEQSPGESVERFVIRSNYDKSTAEYATFFGDFTNNPEYSQFTERHIAPPKTSQLMAEQHGMFDIPSGMNNDISTYNDIKNREAWQFPEFHDENHLDVLYLPDPTAQGVAFRFLPAIEDFAPPPYESAGFRKADIGDPINPEWILKRNFYLAGPSWSKLRSFRIILTEGDDPPLPDPLQPVLWVYLQKAEVKTVRISSYISEENLEKLGMWDWIDEEVSGQAQTRVKLRKLALHGQHWMLTPYRELVLGHAVQQPMKVPKLQLKQVVDRNHGETFASPLSYDLPGKRLEIHEVHGKSTVKVDVLAEWQEPIDALADEVPRDGRLWGQPMISGKAHVFEAPVQLDGLLVSAGGGNVQYDEISQRLIFMHLPRHEFGDTKYRKVRYKAVATTRFAEYFRPRVADEKVILTGTDAQQLAHAGIVEGSEVVASSDRKVTFVRGTDYTMDYSNSKIARIDAGAIASGETVLVSYTYHPQVTEEITLTSTTAQQLTHTALAEESEVVITPDGGVTYHRDVDYTVDYPNGKIARIEGGGIANGATIRVSYPLPITRESEWVTIDIPSSARPAAPKILYVIPTFGWEKPQVQSGKPIVSKRLGGGLRVYMERPWYSSGDGELLGVVLASSLDDYKDDRLKPCITQWGADPLWQLQLTPDMPLSEHFARRVSDATASGLALEEMEVTGKTVSVVGHEVGYDKDRQLWYSDIDIDFGPAYSAYFPFVRLALARYQPNSITNAHLSRVVLADFAQLAPNRTASIVFKDPTHLTISVSGPIGSRKLDRNEIEVSVEERNPQIEGDLGWVPTKEKPIRQSTHQQGAGVIWIGEITLPKRRGSQRFRLVIKEYELYYEGIEEDPKKKKERLVYADALEI